MTKSKIEWTDKTWNPITGCSKYSEGCQNCYAEKMHKRLTAMGQEKYQEPFSKVNYFLWALDKDFGKKPKMIFVNSMSDTFHNSIANEEIAEILQTINFKENKKHTFQILTKRAERIVKFSYPPNVWLGVTVEMAKYKNRIEYLKQTNAKVKFLSCEPLLEDLGELDLNGIDWVIVGGESGRNARPCNPDWVRNIQRQCKEQNVPFLFKQWGEFQPYYTIEKHMAVGMSEIKNPLPKLCFKRLGKTKSGALLDGKEYKEFPRCFYEK